jgi:LmbE family N-acetylglucosaminyl deacetylase
MPPLKKVLCVGAHPDDIEFGCGATLHKHLKRRKDWDVRCITLGRSLDPEIGCAHKKALAHMGVDGTRIELHDLPTSHMAGQRQAAWAILDRAWRAFRPELVLTHEADYHQDHEMVCRESMRTFYDCSVLLYGISRSQSPAFEGAYYEVVDDEDVGAKLQGLAHYGSLKISDGLETTTYSSKPYFRREAILGKMAYDGIGGLARYAEVYRIARMIGP